MVAGGDHVAQVAGDPGEGVVDRRDAVALAPGDAAHFSATGALVAKARAIGSWPACRTLIPKRLAAWTASRVREPRSRQASISIGSIESEQTALAVAPAGPSGPVAVTIVTPVGSIAIAARKLAGSGGGIVRRRDRSRQYDARRVRPALIIAMVVAAALGLAACGFGEEGISVSKNDPNYNGAVLFATHCSGCHTLSAAGTQGTGNRGERTQGPNLNQRTETYEDWARWTWSCRTGSGSGITWCGCTGRR